MQELNEEQHIRAVYDNTGSIRATARLTGASRPRVKRIIEELGPVYTGQVLERPTYTRPIPSKGKKRYYLLSSAQNSSKIHPVLDSLLAYADDLRSREDTEAVEVMISRFVYVKKAFLKEHQKPGSDDEYQGLVYDERITEFINDDRVELAPSLVWCGEMNILPTAVRPLSGFETYTGRSSSIIPHVKMQMESIAQMKGTGAKLNYTTGTVTMRNYLQRKAGLKAEFHHVYGGLIVEVDEDGTWFVRQLSADADGSFQDLDTIATPTGVTHGHPIEAINWPDFHYDAIDEDWILDTFWVQPGNVLDTLNPSVQVFNDCLDFRRRSHHDRKNTHLNFEKFIDGVESVSHECEELALFFADYASRPHVTSLVVESNHDNALEKWLNECDYREDHVNALFFLKWQLAIYTAIAEKDSNFHLLREVLNSFAELENFVFLDEDESWVICKEHGGIELGMHGHLGPNGARGGTVNLSKMGRRANVGHMHSAAIRDGLFVAGTCAMNPDYAKGPSAWSISFIVTYPNGKRTMITCWEGKWRA